MGLFIMVSGTGFTGGTVVLVEHNFGLVLEVADDIYVLANGEVVAWGPPAEIRSHPAVLREYLGISADELEPVLDEGGREP